MRANLRAGRDFASDIFVSKEVSGGLKNSLTESMVEA